MRGLVNTVRGKLNSPFLLSLSLGLWEGESVYVHASMTTFDSIFLLQLVLYGHFLHLDC